MKSTDLLNEALDRIAEGRPPPPIEARGVRSSGGIRHCGELWEWKALEAKVVDGEWYWFCPMCKVVLRQEPYYGWEGD